LTPTSKQTISAVVAAVGAVTDIAALAITVFQRYLSGVESR